MKLKFLTLLLLTPINLFLTSENEKTESKEKINSLKSKIKEVEKPKLNNEDDKKELSTKNISTLTVNKPIKKNSEKYDKNNSKPINEDPKNKSEFIDYILKNAKNAVKEIKIRIYKSIKKEIPDTISDKIIQKLDYKNIKGIKKETKPLDKIYSSYLKKRKEKILHLFWELPNTLPGNPSEEEIRENYRELNKQEMNRELLSKISPSILYLLANWTQEKMLYLLGKRIITADTDLFKKVRPLTFNLLTSWREETILNKEGKKIIIHKGIIKRSPNQIIQKVDYKNIKGIKEQAEPLDVIYSSDLKKEFENLKKTIEKPNREESPPNVSKIINYVKENQKISSVILATTVFSGLFYLTYKIYNNNQEDKIK